MFICVWVLQSLEFLNCPSNQLTSLDVSKNAALTTLRCSPMEVDGSNVLATLYIAQGQESSNIIIPEETVITIVGD